MLKNITKIVIVIFLFSCKSENIENDPILNQDVLVQVESFQQTEEDLGCSGLIPNTKPTGDFKTLIWSDEFDNDGQVCDKIGMLKLYPQIMEVGGIIELQYYTDDRKNLKVEDGLLKITALRESYKGKVYIS